MVAVVQLVERQVVILEVAGSSPVSHPRMVGGHFALRLSAFGTAGMPPRGAAQPSILLPWAASNPGSTSSSEARTPQAAAVNNPAYVNGTKSSGAWTSSDIPW
ncbi:MAG: hypothetical protein QOH27_4438 [Mycobacterium sp.]|jgi:hypothetical protein|nr:hypothetical protein [Mycobacterium sp.]